ncbi:MAG: hypothetical protein GX115_02345 [Ruminiclostridium sp.]|nr:hypothetical protein [Ruminiclostridium sp.]
MRYLQKLPLLLALAAAFLTGLIGFVSQASQKVILTRMVLMMVVFFVIGLFTRSTLLNIKDQVEQKKNEREAEERKQKQELEKKQKEQEMGLGNNIDLSAGAEDEDTFEPLPVSEFIKKELKSG